MGWSIVIDARTDEGVGRHEDQIPTPHLHIAIESALYKHGLSNAKSGSYQITATAS